MHASQFPYIQEELRPAGRPRIYGRSLYLQGLISHLVEDIEVRDVTEGRVTSNTRVWGRGLWTRGRKERQEQGLWLARWRPGTKMSHLQEADNCFSSQYSFQSCHFPSIPAPVSWAPLQGLGSLTPWPTHPRVPRTPQARASLSLGASEGLTVFVISPFNPQMGQRLTLF